MNVFVVNTPFQYYVVRRIIEHYFCSADNAVIYTVSNNPKTQDKDIICVPHGVKGLAAARRALRGVRKNIHSASFFIPHLGNLFSSVFFEWAKRYHRPISVYYEGVALFYDPVRPNLKEKRKRNIEGFLLGVRYIHHEQLFTKELIDYADGCYSPILTPLLDKYKSVKKIDFSRKDLSGTNQNILLLTSNAASKEVIADCVADIKKYVEGPGQTVYIKPHYALDPEKVDLFVEQVKHIDNVKVILLDKHIPIEELFDEIYFRHVVCQHFTSSIINMSLIYGKDLTCKVTDKSYFPKDMLKELGIVVM